MIVADGGHVSIECRSHSDCVAGANGRCTLVYLAGLHCSYDECFSDGDCAVAQVGSRVCGCESGLGTDNNVCLPGNCSVDADCGEGRYCSPTKAGCINVAGYGGYYCHTDADECLDDANCAADGGGNRAGACVFMPTLGHWQCGAALCAG